MPSSAILSKPSIFPRAAVNALSPSIPAFLNSFVADCGSSSKALIIPPVIMRPATDGDCCRQGGSSSASNALLRAFAKAPIIPGFTSVPSPSKASVKPLSILS